MLRKAQSSVEFAAVVFIALLVIIPVALYAFQTLSFDSDMAQARIAVQQLAYSADSVAAQGEGAMQEVKVFLPANVNFSSPRTRIAGKEVSLAMLTNKAGEVDVYATTKANVSGSFPQKTGVVFFTVSLNQSNIVSIQVKT